MQNEVKVSVVGKIDLPNRKPKVRKQVLELEPKEAAPVLNVKNKKSYSSWRVKFELSDFDMLLSMAIKANKKLGKNTITLSKKGDLVTTFYSCGTKEFYENFAQPAMLRWSLSDRKLKKIGVSQLKSLKDGDYFYFCYLAKNGSYCEFEKMRVIASEKRGVAIKYVSLENQVKDVLYFEEVQKDGSIEMDESLSEIAFLAVGM